MFYGHQNWWPSDFGKSPGMQLRNRRQRRLRDCETSLLRTEDLDLEDLAPLLGMFGTQLHNMLDYTYIIIYLNLYSFM